jgi:hypothetical protein
MTETAYRDFTTCLQQEQGPFLESLSRALEPTVQALMTYSLEGSIEHPVERVDLTLLSSQPKGLLDLG